MAQQQQRYRVIEKIAAGGMAEVYRAESAGLEGFKKKVAIKRVLPHLSEKKQFIGMFLDEARLSAHLGHSNCVQVFDVGVGDNTYFIVMEYVDGGDLKSIIEHYRKRNQTFPVEEALLICVKICEGLDYAHNCKDEDGVPLNIVHRDMSPPNVLITRYGEVKIVDFGLAKANSQLERSEPGIIKGKFSYLSPEAALGNAVDLRTDIFAVGIILWEMLAGRRLFMGETDLETVRQVQAANIPPITQLNPSVPAHVETILARALAGDPGQRYQTARQLASDLTQAIHASERSCSAFDIANLVQDALSARGKPKSVRDRGSIIGTLIDDALFEFTSLDGEQGDVEHDAPGAAPVDLGSAPLNLGSFGFGGAEPEPAPKASFSAGNLAALEEDTLSRRGAAVAHSATAAHQPAAPTPPAPVSAPQPPTNPTPDAKSGGGKGLLIFLIVLLLVVGGGAGAYFGGLLPPDLIPK